LFDDLVARARFPHRFLLSTDIFVQRSLARGKFLAKALNIFIDDRELRFARGEFLFGNASCLSATKAGPDKFGTHRRQPRTTPTDVCRLSFEVRRWRSERLQL